MVLRYDIWSYKIVSGWIREAEWDCINIPFQTERARSARVGNITFSPTGNVEVVVRRIASGNLLVLACLQPLTGVDALKYMR
jgi:hypothetical protein